MEHENNYQKAARKRVERELASDPDKYKTLGSAGGSVKTPKGLAMLSAERRKEISQQGQATRQKNRELHSIEEQHTEPEVGISNETE